MNPSLNPNAAIQDRPDPRDHQWSEVGFGSAPFDWVTGFDIELEVGLLKPKDQNGSGSCGGQAWATYAAVQEAMIDHSLEERSAKFVYAQTYQPNGGGSAGRDNANIYVNQGVCREAMLPSYDGGKAPTEAFMERPQDITDLARIDAKSDLARSYANVNVDIDTIAQAIRDNSGVVLGICGENNGTWTSSYPTPPKTGEWGHWIYAGKAQLINGRKFIGCLNSWGIMVGDRGWQWLIEDYINTTLVNGYQRAVWQVWTHICNEPATELTHKFAADIHYGDNGPEVVALQKALQIDGEFPQGTPTTGFYGDVTRRAVLAFQVRYAVAPTTQLVALAGKVVGPATRGALNKLFDK